MLVLARNNNRPPKNQIIVRCENPEDYTRDELEEILREGMVIHILENTSTHQTKVGLDAHPDLQILRGELHGRNRD